ncbi:predicted protein [Histoplasma capsulatum H143]|uniref:Uncharacterized protein n=1 Tax=Ajellomyces capsulatus (strain H143) TaxID=544712 RepID=C6H999_AJECH|nr:predicted protein [Histoplasma capsulatum H143]
MAAFLSSLPFFFSFFFFFLFFLGGYDRSPWRVDSTFPRYVGIPKVLESSLSRFAQLHRYPATEKGPVRVLNLARRSRNKTPTPKYGSTLPRAERIPKLKLFAG